jgi:hypothetical protein
MKYFGGGPIRGTTYWIFEGMTRMHCSKLLGVFGGGGGGIMLLRSVLRLAPFESGASLAFRAWLCGRIRVLGTMPFSTALISLKWEKVPSQSTVHAAIVQTLESVVAARRARIISSMVWIETANGSGVMRLRRWRTYRAMVRSMQQWRRKCFHDTFHFYCMGKTRCLRTGRWQQLFGQPQC